MKSGLLLQLLATVAFFGIEDGELLVRRLHSLLYDRAHKIDYGEQELAIWSSCVNAVRLVIPNEEACDGIVSGNPEWMLDYLILRCWHPCDLEHYGLVQRKLSGAFAPLSKRRFLGMGFGRTGKPFKERMRDMISLTDHCLLAYLCDLFRESRNSRLVSLKQAPLCYRATLSLDPAYELTTTFNTSRRSPPV